MKAKTSSTAALLPLAGAWVACLVVLLLGLPAVAGATILEASATAATTTTSTTDVLMAGMTLTPGAGDYLAVFSTSVKNDGVGQSKIFASIYVNGVQQAHTERQVLQESSIRGFEQPLMTYAHITVGAGQAVEIRWRTDVANTITADARTLNLFPVASAAVSQATATVDTTLNSSAYTLLPGMTLTPGAGTYLAIFSTSAEGVSGAEINTALFVGGTQVLHTERSQTQEPSIPSTAYTYAIIAKVVPTAGQAVEVRWNNTGTAGIITAHQRTLTLYKVNATDIFEASDTADTTSTATADALLLSMTLTPGAGNYLAFFSSSFFYGTIIVSPVTFHSFYVNGVKVAHTERQPVQESSIDSTDIPVATNGVVSPGAGQAVEVRWRSSTTDLRTAHERTFLLLKEATTTTTTIGNGTDPASTTIAPSGAATMADAFTFATSSGTDSVTAVTVTLAAGTSGGLSLVEITNDAGSTVYGSVANPATDTPSITLTTPISVTTTATQYKIRITPKTHANMPAPPGSSYAVTARISAWTGTNAQAGTDSAGTTVTIDNLSPANVTGATATAGNAQVTVSWTNPGADFSNVVILRNTPTTVTDVPAEGSSPLFGDPIGASTVRYNGSGTSFTDTGLANGTPYFYRIFAKDTSGNYSQTGVEVSATPTGGAVAVNSTGVSLVDCTSSTSCNLTTLTVGTGTNRVLYAIVDSTNTATTPTVTWNGVALTQVLAVNEPTLNSRIRIFRLVAPASGNFTLAVSGFPTATNIAIQAIEFSGVDQTNPEVTADNVTTTGNSTSPSATITSAAGDVTLAAATTADAYTAQTQTLLNRDNSPPTFSDAVTYALGGTSNTHSFTTSLANGWAVAGIHIKAAATCATPTTDASYVAVNAQNGQATVYWSSPAPVIILKKTGAFTTEAPTNGTTHTVGQTGGSLGTATVANVGTGVATSFTEAVANGTLYYKVFANSSTCYSPGTVNTTAGVNASPAASPQTWSYAMAGGSILKGGIAGTGTVYTSSNAKEMISLNTANGTQSWAPVATTAAIQGWLSWLPISGGGAAVIGGDQGGKVYSVNTATGATNWSVTLTGADAVQAAVSAQLRAYSNAAFQSTYTTDVIFAATRNASSTNNKLVALNASNGSVLWTFNGTGANNVDYIVGQPWVDYARNYVYVASRGPGTQPNLWVINSLNGSLVASLSLGTNVHLQTSPTLSRDGKTLYVADTSGNLYALDTTSLPVSLTKKWTSPAALGETAVTLVQEAPLAQGTTVTSLTATFAAHITPGNALIATFSSNHGGTVTSPSVTGGGVTWTQAVTVQIGIEENLYIYYGTNSSGGTQTVTINGTSDNWVLEVSEWSGLANSGTLDVTGSATGTGTSPSSGNVTTTNANDLLIAFETDFSGAPPSAGPTNSFTALNSGSLNQPHNPAYRIVSATGTYNTGWTLGATNSWGGVIAAFKAGGAIADTSFVWEDSTTAGRLYFSTADGNVWCLQDLGPGAPPSLTTPCSGWSAVKTAVPGPSTPLLLNKLFVGSWNGTLGQIYQLNPSTGAIEKQVTVGDGTKRPGDVSTETGNEIFVGTSEGKIFNFPLTGGSL